MPSCSNPNTPTKFKRKTASTLKSKRRHIKHLCTADNKAKVNKNAIPRTSQAIRQNASLSRKKARKLEKKERYTRQRKELEKFLEAEVEMKDMEGKKAAKMENLEMGKEKLISSFEGRARFIQQPFAPALQLTSRRRWLSMDHDVMMIKYTRSMKFEHEKIN
ncbi:MAG: hypothetical protein L6R41_007573 [Letrouitia leprolyta]|nr:MAG: hypothetical protein L6R41_007573 [Letrouitia leprolyta]